MMISGLRMLLGMLGVFCALSVSAESVTNKLVTSSERRAFTNANDWATQEGVRCDWGPLDPTVDYLVVEGKTLSTPNIDQGEAVFGGRSLTLGQDSRMSKSGSTTGNMRLYPYGTSKLTFNAPGLYLTWGRVYLNWGSTFNLAGQVTVKATAHDPFGITAYSDNQTLNISAKFLGDETAYMLVLPDKSSGYAVQITNTESDYRGRIRVEAGTAANAAGAAPNATLELGSIAVGSVIVYGHAGISTATAADVATVGDLEFRDNAVIAVKSAWSMQSGEAVGSSGKIIVTNALTFAADGIVHVRVQGLSAVPNATVQRVPILQVPYGTGLTTNRFNLVAAEGYLVGNTTLAVDVDQAAGVETLVAVSEPVVALAVSDAFSMNAEGYTSALDNASQWSDGQLPHDGVHYYVGQVNGAGVALRTQWNQYDAPYEIKGLSLTIGDQCGFYVLRKIHCAHLRMTEGATLTNGQWVPTVVITGGVVEVSKEAKFCASDTHTIVIESALEGDGQLISCGMSGTSYRQGNLVVNGNNAAYYGTYRLTSLMGPGDPEADTQSAGAQYQTIRFASAASLGAPLAAFNPRALELNNWGTLKQDVSVDFADATRGLYVDERGQVIVAENQTVALRADTTYCGELRKRGLGCLALGGTARFDSADGIGAVPQANSNLLTVTKGDLKALTSTCLDGVRVTFTDASSALRLDVDATDATLLEKGVLNVKEEVPLTFAGSTLPIQLDRAGAQPIADGLRMEIGLLTVREAVADALRGKLAVSVRAGTFANRRRITLQERTDPDTGFVTFYCVIERNGLMLMVR